MLLVRGIALSCRRSRGSSDRSSARRAPAPALARHQVGYQVGADQPPAHDSEHEQARCASRANMKPWESQTAFECGSSCSARLIGP